MKLLLSPISVLVMLGSGMKSHRHIQYLENWRFPRLVFGSSETWSLATLEVSRASNGPRVWLIGYSVLRTLGSISHGSFQGLWLLLSLAFVSEVPSQPRDHVCGPGTILYKMRVFG